MSGFGSSPYGSGPYGGPASTFAVSSVTPVDYRTVDVVFTQPLASTALNLALIASIGAYSIFPTLQAVAAIVTAPDTIRMFTLPQNEGANYRLAIATDFRDTFDQSLGTRIGTWVALAGVTKHIVEDLDARSECGGKAVYLNWTLPEDPTTTQVKIVRRLKAWPFDLTDTHDVVYEGAAIEEFVDTGIMEPVTDLTVSVSPGDTLLFVSSTVGMSPGDVLRIETLTGTPLFETRTISFIGAAVVLTEGVTNSYPVGARVAKSSELQAQTYYYYLVLASVTVSPPYEYDIDDLSRVFGLSIDAYSGKQWFVDNTPRHDLALDAKSLADGGGGGFLDSWFTIMGCWLNLMRGHINALALTADPDAAPFHTLTAKNQSLGIEPEGFAYDLDIVRRPLTSLVYVYKRKGTCPGIVETVSMFTKWEASCREFAFNQCQGGAGTLKTWDGNSQLEYGQETAATVVMEVTSAEGAARFYDPGQTWSDDLWKDGALRGWIGDIACIDTNVDNEVTVLAPRQVTTLTVGESAGDSSIAVASTIQLIVGMSVQIISTTETSLGSGVYASEIVEVSSVTPGVPGTIGIRGTLASAYPIDSVLTIGKSILRREFTGTATVVGQVLTDTSAVWVENQWVGYQLLASDNVKHAVVSNTGTTVTVDGAAPAVGAYSIAKDFAVAGSFAARIPLLRYKITNNVHSTFFEPTLDLQTKGTIYDPFTRLYNGPAAVLSGVYGPSDVAAFISTNVAVAIGRAQSVTGFVFDLDTNQPAPTVNEWQGYYLNPNQNQEQMFEILENTTTTLTIAGDVGSLVTAGQYYYVLKPRDRVRYQRITTRLRKEFTDTDVKIHVLFV